MSGGLIDRAAELHRAADALAAASGPGPRVVVGFDGFIDHIIDVVDQRQGPQQYRALPTISSLGQRIAAAAGRSANLELVVKTSKLGGNGPILANALCAHTSRLCFIGCIGDSEPHPAFAPLAAQAEELVCLGPPAETDALEFSDGKIMLCKAQPLDAVDFALLERRVGIGRLRALISAADGVATVNWTETLSLSGIWQGLLDSVLPELPRRPLWFVDIGDPAKRPAEELRAALALLGRMQRHVDVVLGLNQSETRQVLAVCACEQPALADEEESARLSAAAVREALGISGCLCHFTRVASYADGHGSWARVGFFTPKPRISTGAGDHFNAGFLAASLLGLEPCDRLHVGAATTGCYMRSVRSPSREELIAFLRAEAGS